MLSVTIGHYQANAVGALRFSVSDCMVLGLRRKKDFSVFDFSAL